MSISWGPEYEIGIRVIDSQHQRLVDYINTLERLLTQPDARLGVSRVLYDLIDYTESHFGFEEALMAQAGYGDLDSHRQAHEKFVARIEALQLRHDDGEAVAGALISLLEKWLLQHILVEDQAYTLEVRRWIDSIGLEGLGRWINDNFRRHFRHS